MLQNFQDAVKFRAIVVFIMVHMGLALGIYGLAQEAIPNGWNLTAELFLSSILLLYGGILLAAFFIIWPLLPWFKRIQKIEHWTDRMLRELPTLLEHLPKILIAIQSLKAAWNESKAKPPKEKSGTST